MIKMSNRRKKEKRLGLTFHRSFSLNRPSISQVLQVLYDLANSNASPKKLKEILREKTSLGTIYVEAMPRYCKGSGLIDFDNTITEFGNIVINNDSLFSQPGTQWLMHYYLSSPQGPGPAFWNNLVTTRFRTREEFTSEQISDQIFRFVVENEGRELKDRSVRTTATVFLGTYLKSDGLNKLGILQEIKANYYRVLSPDPPILAIAYALIEYCKINYGDRITINLDDLTIKNGFANLFMIGSSKLDQTLNTLHQEGFVDIYRTAPPYQVVLLRSDGEVLLRKLYGLE